MRSPYIEPPRRHAAEKRYCELPGYIDMVGRRGRRSNTRQNVSHLVGGAERHTNGFRKSIRRPGDEDTVRPEMLDAWRRGRCDIEHHEVRVRINRPQHSRVRLVEEFLPVVRVPLHRPLDVLGIVERAMAATAARALTPFGQTHRRQPLAPFPARRRRSRLAARPIRRSWKTCG